ncbi:hypothetical protein M422DRAFT_275179 [Sphaerobolus stellatus SS14]|uniref:Uncharacterized protein n=1 Tax=Sphaerobolus stellatus (strain SS14) TaxID=990650 RepID=A0A0C9UFW9_SPHS4|nr:hypothetical protein M422DRAFT_275179 [Sphaerobolus stellatus SS14]
MHNSHNAWDFGLPKAMHYEIVDYEKKAIEEFKGQIQYFERILSDLQSLIDEAADAPGNMSQDYSQLETYLKTCTSKLQEFVDKFKPSLSKWKGLLHHFTWPLKDEEQRGLVDLVNQYKNSIQLELTVKQSQAIQAVAAAVQAEWYNKDILKWLKVEGVEVNSNFDRARERKMSSWNWSMVPSKWWI